MTYFPRVPIVMSRVSFTGGLAASIRRKISANKVLVWVECGAMAGQQLYISKIAINAHLLMWISAGKAMEMTLVRTQH